MALYNFRIVSQATDDRFCNTLIVCISGLLRKLAITGCAYRQCEERSNPENNDNTSCILSVNYAKFCNYVCKLK